MAVIKKVMPKGRIAIKLYKVAVARPTTTTKNSSQKCCAVPFTPKVSFSTVHFTRHVDFLKLLQKFLSGLVFNH